MEQKVRVIGAGLAGTEAAYYLANKNYLVELYEMRPNKMTPAHQTDKFAELVCSNSLRGNDLANAVGLLKYEMNMFNSLVIESAYKNEIPAGGALAVDREGFSSYITNKIKNHPNIKIITKEYENIDLNMPTIIATGPLTSEELTKDIQKLIGNENLYFYDAAAPIISADSINYDVAYLKSRYDKGEAAYLNCPMDEAQFKAFYNELINAEVVKPKEFEQMHVFEACMPIEVMAKRGEKTMLFGPLKPVGLSKEEGQRPYAVVQLRQDDAAKSLYNIVGFQTHLKWSEQKRIIQMIPGLENAQIVRYGVMHRNTYINSPGKINNFLQLKIQPNIFFAGQMTGVEGYVESAATGIYAAVNMDNYLQNKQLLELDETCAIGALTKYISNESLKNIQPMNINFGLIKSLDQRIKNKQEKNQMISKRAIEYLEMKIRENNEI